MKLYIIAGEMSGDKHGSLLLKELHRLKPGIEVQGLGGALMHEYCPAVEDWTDESAVVGFVEVAKKYGWFRKRFLATLEQIKKDRPECLVLIDYPGFNLRMAERVHKACPDTKIVYFISPQVWAWHKGRIPKMAKILDMMLCIFPFEKPIFEQAGLPTEFVGHPLVDEIQAIRQTGIRENDLIGLFPGSRNREIDKHFPVFIEIVKSLKKSRPEWRFETAASNERLAERMRGMIEKSGLTPEALNIRLGSYHSLMDRAYAGVIASGTATLEAAIHGLPYVLVYKVSWSTALIMRMLLSIPYVGMVNILSKRSVVKELLQNNFTALNVIGELERLATPNQRTIALEEMQAAVDKLGPGGAAKRAAEAIINLMEENSSQKKPGQNTEE